MLGPNSQAIEAQTEQALMNLATVLSTAGSSMDNVAKTTIFYANVEDVGRLNAVYAQTPPQAAGSRAAPSRR